MKKLSTIARRAGPTYYKQPENVSLRFSGSPEADSSGLPENLEVVTRFKTLTTHWCVNLHAGDYCVLTYI